MEKIFNLLLIYTLLIPTYAFPAGRIQDSDVKSLTDVGGSGNASRLINTSKLYDVYNSQQLSTSIANGQLGGGGGGGSKNYLSSYTASTSGGTSNTGNGNFEKNATTGFSLFNTTLTSLFPTGSVTAGASSITTFATTGTNALTGKYSLNTASSAAITAGQGFISDAFNIDTSDQGKTMSISAAYSVISGLSNLNLSGTPSNTFAAYIYDVTNSAWIQPAGVYNMVQGSGVGKWTGTFQATSNSTQYRLAFIAVNASAGASSIYWDDLSVGPQSIATGPAMSDWVSYSPTVVGLNGTTVARWKRVGDSMEVQGSATFNSSGAPVSWPLPSGYSVDTLKASSSDGLGTGVASHNANSTGYSASATYTSSTAIRFDGSFGSGGTVGRVDTSANRPFTWASGDTFQVYFTVPIAGWSSNSVQSNDTDTRVISLTAGLTSNQVIASGGQIIYDTIVKDTAGMYSTSTGKVTAPVSGQYSFSVIAESSSTPAIYAQVNGVNKNYVTSCANAGKICAGSFILSLNAGDQVAIYGDTAGTMGGSSVFQNLLSVQRISGPAVVQTSETVSASYSSAAAQSLSSVGVVYFIDFGTKEKDDHSSVVGAGNGISTTATNTWRFVAPISGSYQVNASVGIAYGNGTSYDQRTYIAVNGAAKQYSNVGGAAAPYDGGNIALPISGLVQLNAGDYVSIGAFQYSPGAQSTNGVSQSNRVSIVRVGN